MHIREMCCKFHMELCALDLDQSDVTMCISIQEVKSIGGITNMNQHIVNIKYCNIDTGIFNIQIASHFFPNIVQNSSFS